jgi:argininosuccinate lyase
MLISLNRRGDAMLLKKKFSVFLLGSVLAANAFAQKLMPRDEFFWLGQMNKASAVINTEEGLLDSAKAGIIAAGIAKVMEDGGLPDGRRPSSVISFEPLLIRAAGQDVTLLHAGRSSQDMHATFRAAILREDLLALASQLGKVSQTLVQLAQKHVKTIVPNYTNGVAAQPNSYGHYLLGHAAGLERDAQRIREVYARIDRSAMGTTVLNGSSWPLNRTRMADYLGFAAIVDNAYDASQISSTEHPVEVGAVVTSIALHAGHFIEDLMTQYAQSRPWILLQEGGGNTYVSSAMPQKRNPGLLNDARRDASTAIALAMGPLIRAHNITPGMADAKDSRLNTEMVNSAIRFLQSWDKILNALVISPERALEELNSDWTASQELADLLMRKYKLPFRVGHHFASDLVDFAKTNNIKPLDFPYAQAQRIYQENVKESGSPQELPITEIEFRSTLNPIAIIENRTTVGGPQASEMQRMLAAAYKKNSEHIQWIEIKKSKIDTSLKKLDADFLKLMKN